MTMFEDNIESGLRGLTSAQSSRGQVLLTKTFSITGGANSTKTATLPTGVRNLDAKLYILSQGTAATTDNIRVSAGTTPLINITSVGSAIGVLRVTTAGLGTLSSIASACAAPTTTAETTITVVTSSESQAGSAPVYQLQLMYNRVQPDQAD